MFFKTKNIKIILDKLDFLFSQLDTDGNRSLSKTEVLSAFEKANKNASEAQLFFKLMDANGDG